MKGAGFFIYLVLVVSWFLHMPARLPFLGTIRFDVLLMAAGFLAYLLSGGAKLPSTSSKTGRALTLLILYVILSLPLVEWPGSVLRQGLSNFVKAVVFYYFTVGFVTSEKRMAVFLFVFIGCQLFRILEPLYLNVTQDYWGSLAYMEGFEYMDRLAGAPHDVINPNGLAFVVLTVIPFLHYESAVSSLYRIRYLLLAPLAIATLMLTGSRSGVVGMAVLMAAIFFKTKKKVFMGAVFAAGLMVVSAHLTSQLSDRYSSILSSDSKNAVTAKGRIEGVKSNIRVFLKRPLFGYGLGTSLEANAHYGGYGQITHNMYVEAAQELGIIGFIIMCFFWKSVLQTAWGNVRSLKKAGNPAGLKSRADAIQIWLAMNVIFSLASYGVSTYDWYLFAGLSAAMSALASKRVAQVRTVNHRKDIIASVLTLNTGHKPYLIGNVFLVK